MKRNIEKQQLVHQWMIKKVKTCSEQTKLVRLASVNFCIYSDPKWLDDMAREVIEMYRQGGNI